MNAPERRETTSVSHMVAVAVPWLLFVTSKDGKTRLRSESERTGCTSLQFLEILKADRRNLELIDAAGNYFRRVEGFAAGIDWKLYWRGGLFGLVALVIGLVFLTVMVRIRLEPAAPATPLPLLEIKRRVREAILSNPRRYTHAPPQEIVGRVNAARDTASLIRSIFRD